MKKFKRVVAAGMIGTMGFISTGCFGEFQLVRTIWNFNDEVVSSKFVKTLLFYVMNFIPVYGVAGALDFFIFNLIEFWGGSNPLAMEDGDYEEQIFEKDGIQYRMEVTKNQYALIQLTGEDAGQKTVLSFDEDNLAWNYSGEDYDGVLMAFEGENFDKVRVFDADRTSTVYQITGDVASEGYCDLRLTPAAGTLPVFARAN